METRHSRAKTYNGRLIRRRKIDDDTLRCFNGDARLAEAPHVLCTKCLDAIWDRLQRIVALGRDS